MSLNFLQKSILKFNPNIILNRSVFPEMNNV